MGFIKFLGTAGARFVMIRQLRSSGGIWINYGGANVIIDPGPGAIVRCNRSRPPLDPTGLDAVILTHKHLDHSGDVNVMIEAMTEGGFRKRGVLFAPQDSFGKDGVVFSYLEKFPEKIVYLKEGTYTVGDIKFEVPLKNMHQVETYGLKFTFGRKIVSFVSDTKYFDALVDAYSGSDILVLNVVFYKPRPDYYHLCLDEALKLVKEIRPKQAIITHFGMSMLKARPHVLERKIQKEVASVMFAYDGLTLSINKEQ